MKVTAHAVRSGGWWAVDVPEVPGVFTQAKRLDQVAELVADAVSLMTDVPQDQDEVAVSPDLPEPAASHLAQQQEVQARADAAVKEAAELKRGLIRELRDDAGMNVRDVGRVIGVSPQRVSQLVSS